MNSSDGIQAKTKSRLLQLSLVVFLCLLLANLTFWIIYHTTLKKKKQYTVGVFYNSVNLQPDDIKVIKFLVDKRTDEINKAGGIGGHHLKIQYLDDKGNNERARNLVKASLKDTYLIAFIGSWGTSRVQAVADLIGKNNIPYLGGYSVSDIALDYPTMYSYENSLDHIVFILNKLLQAKSKRVAFIGNRSDIFSENLLLELKQLQDQAPGYQIVSEKWYPEKHIFKKPELQLLIDSLRQQADFLILSMNPNHTNRLLAAMLQNKFHIPVFSAFTDIPEINANMPGFENAELYDISVFGIPSALNMRNQKLEVEYKKHLKFSNRLQFELGLGGLYSDILGLYKAASEQNTINKHATIRQKINQGLKLYIEGKRVYHGWLGDWYFTPDRVLANEVLISWKAPTLKIPVLAPEQYLRGDSGLQKAPVLYTSIDMNSLDQISDRAGTFNAAFFLEINSTDTLNINQIDFVNAVRNDIDQKPSLTIQKLEGSIYSKGRNFYHYLYQITGQFYFKPELGKYPFDEQRFSITMQTNSAFRPFLIQPPDQKHSDTVFISEGWNYKNHFVGFDQDLISSPGNFIRKVGQTPYYKFSYTYVMKRGKVDFSLKILTPLLVILVLSYFSAFVPIREFVSVAAIQATALLSTIALYFSVYKPALATATISDNMFIFTYIMITTMIGVSVTQYWLYRRRRYKRKLGIALGFYEKVLFPILVIGYSLWLIIV